MLTGLRMCYRWACFFRVFFLVTISEGTILYRKAPTILALGKDSRTESRGLFVGEQNGIA